MAHRTPSQAVGVPTLSMESFAGVGAQDGREEGHPLQQRSVSGSPGWLTCGGDSQDLSSPTRD